MKRKYSTKIEELRIENGQTVTSAEIADCFRLKKITIEKGSLIFAYYKKLPQCIEVLEFPDNCVRATVGLNAFLRIGEIKFPKKYNPNIEIKVTLTDSSLLINKLSRENKLELLEYCPEAYMHIDSTDCDKLFRQQAKDAITHGMAARQEAKGYQDVKGDIATLQLIKQKMERDAYEELSPKAKLTDAMSKFYKD